MARPDTAPGSSAETSPTGSRTSSPNCSTASSNSPTQQALAGHFSDHHAFLVDLHLRLIDQHTAAIAAITARIEEAMSPFLAARELIATIPGIGIPTADVIIAEIGADMTRFPTPGNLASWAGVCPGHHESAGRSKSSKTRPGNR